MKTETTSNVIKQGVESMNRDPERELEKQTHDERVEAVAEAIKADDVTVNPETGRPINMPGQTDGYKDNLNNPYSTQGRNLGPLEADELQEKLDGAIKAEMNGNPAGAAELRRQAEELRDARKLNAKDDKRIDPKTGLIDYSKRKDNGKPIEDSK